jgi:hypothetical protein
MKATNNRAMRRKGKSGRRRRKYPSTSGMAKYADHTPKSETMCVHPSAADQLPQCQRGKKSDVSNRRYVQSKAGPPHRGWAAGGMAKQILN